MATIDEIAPVFIEMAHRIVWCSVATVDGEGRPRSRVLHPYWEVVDGRLVGWIATGPTPVKSAHLVVHPFVSCNYWAPSHDTCAAEAAATWCFDDPTRQRIWDVFKNAPAPVGYDPAIIPPWKDGPLSPAFAVLRLDPWFLRVFPGTALTGRAGAVLTWRATQ